MLFKIFMQKGHCNILFMKKQSDILKLNILYKSGVIELVSTVEVNTWTLLV